MKSLIEFAVGYMLTVTCIISIQLLNLHIRLFVNRPCNFKVTIKIDLV